MTTNNKKTEQYTSDFVTSLSYATFLSESKDTNILLADEIFFGVYYFMRESEYLSILRKFVGIKETFALDEYFENTYDTTRESDDENDDEEHHQYINTSLEEANEMVQDHEELLEEILSQQEWHIDLLGEEWSNQREIDEELQQELGKLVNGWITNLTFVVLLYISSLHLSSQLTTHLKKHGIDAKKLAENCHNILHHQGINKVGVFAFLQTLDKLLNMLHLDTNSIEMMQMGNLEDIQEIMNSFESDVLEREGGDNGWNNDNKEKKSDKKEEKKMTIEYFGTDLTKEAKDKALDPVIGRDKEIEQVIYTLLRKTKNNPLLIGEAGVGKTAIVEWLAQKIITGNVPEKLKNKKIYMVDMWSLVAGTKYRGEFESRFKAIMEEAADVTNNIILFIDELHTIIGAGGASGSDDAAQLIKPLLARGKIKLIGATTFDEYQKHIEKDAALKRRFQEVTVDEPDGATTKEILLWIKSHYEEFHGVKISDEALDNSIKLSQRYVLNKHLPDKAIDIIDEAAARKSTLVQKLDNDETYIWHEKELAKIQKRIEQFIEKQDYFGAAELKAKEDAIKDKMRVVRSTKALPMHLRPEVSKDDVGQVLADKTGIPADVVTESEITKLKRLQEDLQEKILWQEEAVQKIVRTMQRSRLSVVERNKPIASFLFLWASGTGKTYLAKLLAKDYFGDEKALIRLDMSEYMEKYSASKLIGSAPWYVWYESGGMLTEQMRRKPYSVLLLDEIEKASPDILNLLLQIMDEGHIKDAKGRRISFKSTIIIMTSNLGHEEFAKKVATIWFASGDTQKQKNFEDIKKRVMEHVKDFMSPELMNRIDHKIIFKPLSKKILAKIFKQQIDSFLKQRKEQHTTLSLPRYNAQKIATIIDKIYDPQYGARPIEKYIHDQVEPTIIEKMMNNTK